MTGRVGRTSMHLLAAAIDGSQWLSQKMLEFVRTLPFAIQHGMKVGQNIDILKNMAVDDDAVGKLTSIMSEAPVLAKGLKVALSTCWMWSEPSLGEVLYHAKKRQHNGETSKAVSSMLLEASMLFPLDAIIQQWLQEHAQIMKQVSEGETMQTVIKAREKLIAVGIKDVQRFVAAMAELHGHISPVGPGTGTLTEHQKKVMAGVVQEVFKFIDHHSFKPELTTQLEKALDVCDSM